MAARDAICDEILRIMRTYHEQEASSFGVDTPGGLEHMGDVWSLFLRWEQELLAEAPR
jgi:hypothetical protein